MMARSGIACAGNWILDIIHDLPVWPKESDLVRIDAETSGLGGGAANVAADLTALGGAYPIFPIGLFGNDAYGKQGLALCQTLGLATKDIKHQDGVTTAHTHVMNVPGQSRTFFYHAGANDLFAPQHIDIPALAAAGCKILYLGYLTLLPGMDRLKDDQTTHAASVLQAAKNAGMLTCVDLVSINSDRYQETVRGTLAAIDVLFLNEIEAQRATGFDISGPKDIEGLTKAAHDLSARGVERAVVIHTADIVLWHENNTVEVFPVQKIDPSKIVSPVGAGDAFAAGVIHGLHEEFTAADSVRLGFALATAALGGATASDGIPSLEELCEVLPEGRR